ncbi:MAG: HAMP domain-containing histidine kinase [Chloroflexi bacterium]|nr:HAMP domain-containing histidine kinase [Chloroflexota bacterium]
MNSTSVLTGARIIGGLAGLVGAISLILSPFIGESLFSVLWGVEPLAYIGATLLIAGLGIVSLSYVAFGVPGRKRARGVVDGGSEQQWALVTQQYFELFHHDLGRPLRRILGKERELRAILQTSGAETHPLVKELLDEIEGQAPNFRLMMSNIQVLVQLEAPSAPAQPQPVEPSAVVRKIVERYSSVATEARKEITWWAEPTEFGIVYSDSSAIEHIVTNLCDNAVRFATSQVEIKLTKNPSHFFVRVWDDGPGIPAQYMQHIFDRGWTPEVARREEKSSSGVGLFIARTLANRYGGDLTVESVTEPDESHHTAFLLSLPLQEIQVTLR